MTGSPGGERILIIEDEPDILALVTFHLAKTGYRVSTAANGTDGLRAAREDRPALVILDLMLPGLSGFELIERLRGDKATRDIAVLMLTARREEADRIRGLSLGADMLRESLDAFVRADGALGRSVCRADDAVDALHDSVFRILLTHMMENPARISEALELLLVSRNLERVADLATNIGEDAVYLAEGKQIKHHFEERSPSPAA